MLELEPEVEQPSFKDYTFSFNGTGAEYFKLWLLNTILTTITLGFYYPWARAAKLNYLYENTEFNDSPFTFHGTGKEMFIGFLKIFAVYALFMSVFIFLLFTGSQAGEPGYIFLAYLIVIIFLISIVPLAIHGSMKYRASKSSWRGIFFRYDGELGKLYKEYIKGFILTFFTLGIYSFWFRANLRRYVLDNLYLGDAKFNYKGDGEGLIVLHFKLMAIFAFIYFVFVFLVLGIFMGGMSNIGNGLFTGLAILGMIGFYLIILFFGTLFNFWGLIVKNAYHMDNTYINHHDAKGKFHINHGVRYSLREVLPSTFLTVFTLGFGYPFAIVKLLKYFCDELTLHTDIDFDNLQQDTKDFSDATGDDMTSFFDIDLS
jgi:uncharacterized membrane protein YjgN (DUF898 family)